MYLRVIRTFIDHVVSSQSSAMVAVRFHDTFNDVQAFRRDLASAKNIIIFTGAGVSAESGIPTYRVSKGKWREHQIATLTTPEAFAENPGLVWEFYQFRRDRVLKTIPNPAHLAMAKYQKRHEKDKNITLITQNVDNLHNKAGSTNVIELHGNLLKTRCTKCKDVVLNFTNPITPELGDRETVAKREKLPRVPIDKLPHCKKGKCKGLLRPHVLWFGERIEPELLIRAEAAVRKCEVFLMVGTSAVVYPAAKFPAKAASLGAIVAEFNIETSPSREDFKYYFEGRCGSTIPNALKPPE